MSQVPVCVAVVQVMARKLARSGVVSVIEMAGVENSRSVGKDFAAARRATECDNGRRRKSRNLVFRKLMFATLRIRREQSYSKERNGSKKEDRTSRGPSDGKDGNNKRKKRENWQK